MDTHSLAARLAIAICGWLLARTGVEFHLGPLEPAGHNLRDKRGRFRPKEGGGYGLPRDIPHQVADLLFEMGVTAEMYETAAVALKLPDDFEDVEALQLCLREWILHNMDHWVNGQRRGVWGVMQALMHTWALTLYKYKPPQRMRPKQNADLAVGVAPARPSSALKSAHGFAHGHDSAEIYLFGIRDIDEGRAGATPTVVGTASPSGPLDPSPRTPDPSPRGPPHHRFSQPSAH